jgi:hypothetical protein
MRYRFPAEKWVTKLLFSLLTFVSCASGVSIQETVQPEESTWNLSNVNTVLNTSRHESNVYIGISGKMYSREKELEYAKLHIANQIAMNQRCIVDYGYIDMEGTAHDDRMIYDSNFDYDDTFIDEVLSRIEILDEHYFPDITVVIAKDSGTMGQKNHTIERKTQERPKWVRSSPDIDGYYTGVGIGEKYYSQYKSILVADISAAQTIAMERYLYIQGFTYDQVTAGTVNDMKLINGELRLSKAELYGFYILDRWIEPDGTCYSLAIARKK